MRYGSAARRMRNNNNNGSSNNNRGGNTGQRRGIQNKNKVFDSNGPDVRIRGTAYQIVEKYMALAKDTGSAGDRVLAESYLQYAEHYQRIINSWEEEDASYEPADNGAHDQYGKRVSRDQTVSVPEEDLGLPSSILGQAPARQVEKTVELADA